MKKDYIYKILLFMGSLMLGSEVVAQQQQLATSPSQRWITPSIQSAPAKLFVRFKDPKDVAFAYMDAGQQQFVDSEKRRIYNLLTDARIKRVMEPMSVLKNSVSDVLQITLYEQSDMDNFRRELNNDPNVMYVESVPLPIIFNDPNDPLAKDQYHLDLVGAMEAWGKGKTIEGQRDVVLAIVDDGVLITHEDLVANIYINEGEIPNNGRDDDKNGYIDDYQGWDASGDTYENGDPDPNPPRSEASRFNFSHGTHCAGIAGAVTNNSTGGASVTNNGVKILAVKATSDDTPDARAITHSTEALMYAIEMEADIVSMSYGGYGYSATIARMIKEATEEKGMLFVAAAGNDNVNLPSYPAGYDNVIAVANTTSNDVKSPSSQYGAWIDISAPGTDIISTVAADNGNPLGDYAPYTGTSMSCPMVAGAAAFLKTQNINLTPDQLSAVLMGTSTDINPRNPNYQNALGAGRINMSAAMDALQSNRPLAAFNILSDNGIINQALEFENLSFGSNLTYFWTFGDETTSTEMNPSHTYTSLTDLGSYVITLTVKDDQGRENTFRRAIRMTEGPPKGPEETVPFSNDFQLDTGGFVTETVYFDGGDGDDIWEWGRARGDDINSGDSLTWATTLAGGVPLRSFEAYLYTPTFDLTEAGHEYKINFLKSMHITYCNAPAAAKMEYTTDNGGTWKLLGDAFDGLGTGWYNKTPDDACAIHPIIFQDQVGWLGNYDRDSTSYNVSFLTGEKVRFRFVYRMESAFLIEDTDDGFMINNFNLTKKDPSGEFTKPADVAYVNRPIDFIYNSGGATTYAWDFGDGGTSTEKDPTYTYTTAGTYIVKLEVDNNPASAYQDTIGILGIKEAPFLASDGGDLESDELLFYSLNLAGTDLLLDSSAITGKSGTTSGSNAYVLGPDTAGYQVPTGFYLYTSVFDLPGDQENFDSTQMFTFQLKMDVADKIDGMRVEFTDDYGASWRPLGFYKDSDWTNELSSEDHWGGEGIPLMTGSTNDQWVTKYIPLAGFEGEKVAMRLFFVGATLDSSGGIGLAMDDFQVLDYTPTVGTLNYAVDKTVVGLNEKVTFTNASNTSGALIGWAFQDDPSEDFIIRYGEGPHEIEYTTEGRKSMSMFVVGTNEQRDFSNVVNVTTSATANVTSLEGDLAEKAPIIYPNPGVGKDLYIMSKLKINNVNLFKTSGEKVDVPVTLLSGKLDISLLSEGIYILKIEREDGEIFHKKFIKK
ncbi:S8 family serine peptidase [Flammeovirga aprica]|uniref:S8 family serine peptidase n=1 Tax=Flammeovirga aprica JL-4 TaxID=694437 RepID=A0A7X9NYV5_9BACT|nr:S8 family serine peptidase [Flammeovirga aprica]NME66446.1 S8 family serine peptidase [Flammeovirga aprica JL-4]